MGKVQPEKSQSAIQAIRYWALLALSVSALWGIADHLIILVGIFSDFAHLYDTAARQPLRWIFGWWPSSWPSLPTWIIDLVVVWSSVSFASLRGVKRMYEATLGGIIDLLDISYDERRSELPGRSRLAFWAWLQLFALLGLVITPILHYWRPTPEVRSVTKQYFDELIRTLAIIITVLVVLLGFNWQLPQQCVDYGDLLGVFHFCNFLL